MKNKWYIPVFIFLFLLLAYFVRGLFDEHAEYETLREGTVEEMVSAKGLVIKYESVYETGAGGTVETKVANGTRVSKGTLLANVYSGAVDPEVTAKLESVNKRIKAVQASQEEGLSFSGDVAKLDSEIASKVNAMIDYAQKKNMEKVAAEKTSLASLVDRRAVVSGQKSAASNTLDELQQTREELLSHVGAAQKELWADRTGIFLSSPDGLEALISPYNMDSLSPQGLDELLEADRKNALSPKENTEVFSCKIVDNFRYFVALNLDSAKLGNLKAGDAVSLRFTELSADMIDASVYRISEEDGGRCTVICECSKYLDSLLEKRSVSVDFIRHRYVGYRVGVPAIHTKDGVVGVYARRDGVMRFIAVNILYNTQELAIVESADKDRKLKLYDEIVVRANRFEEGLAVN